MTHPHAAVRQLRGRRWYPTIVVPPSLSERGEGKRLLIAGAPSAWHPLNGYGERPAPGGAVWRPVTIQVDERG